MLVKDIFALRNGKGSLSNIADYLHKNLMFFNNNIWAKCRSGECGGRL